MCGVWVESVEKSDKPQYDPRMGQHSRPRQPVALIALSVIVGLLAVLTVAATVAFVGGDTVVQETPVSAPAVTVAPPAVATPAVVVNTPTAAVTAIHSPAVHPVHHVVKHVVKKHHKVKHHHHGHRKHRHTCH